MPKSILLQAAVGEAARDGAYGEGEDDEKVA